MDDRQALLDTIETAHARIATAIDALPDGALLERVVGRWTRKDVIAHLGWWHGHSVAVIDALTADTEPYDRTAPAMTTDAINARVNSEHLADTPEQARRYEADSYRRLIARLETTDPADLFDPGRFPWTGGRALAETIRWDTDRHYADHLTHLTR